MNSIARESAHLVLFCGLLTVMPVEAEESLRAWLVGIKEVPSISSVASGQFRGVIDDRARTLTYELSYSRLEGDVQQAHIHVGQRSVNGAVSVFLCQTEASPDPTGLAPRCPRSGKVSGMVQSGNMIEGNIVSQGVAPGEFDELIRAIRAGVAYVNVHSSTFPAGEVRGQLRVIEPEN